MSPKHWLSRGFLDKTYIYSITYYQLCINYIMHFCICQHNARCLIDIYEIYDNKRICFI